MLKPIVATIALLFAADAAAGMDIGQVQICSYQRITTEQIFDALQRGVSPDAAHAALVKAYSESIGEQQAKLVVELPIAFLRINKLLTKAAAAEFVYLSCDAASKRQHSRELVAYLHDSGERCQSEHANDAKADKKISKCMRKAYEAYESTARAAAADPT